MSAPEGITWEGILFLTVAWGTIIVLVGYCFYRILAKRSRGGDS